MNQELYDEILDALKDRQTYENKINGFYKLRHGQVGRSRKPYPGAPDMRYKLPDTMIEKVKPLYIGQLFAEENLASFVATCEQDSAWTTAASEWFDYQLKQQSNFQREIFIGIDKMLESGAAVIKVYWDTKKKQIAFCYCDLLHIIVPRWNEGVQDSDWFVHIIPYSEPQYRRNNLFVQDDDFIKRIKGRGQSTDGTGTMHEQDKAMREGLTYGKSDEIILWECYRRDGTGPDAQWIVDTISPVAGCEEQVRGTFGLPFTHGKLPFFVIHAEIIDKSWYSPRGITELVAPQETSLNKAWNSKLQHLDFHGVPTYEQNGQAPLGNTINYTPKPGGILPAGLTKSAPSQAPLDFEQEMQFTRALAEDRVAVPDLGASEHISGRHGGQQGERVTATQINAIVGQSSQGSDMRGRTFRLDLADGFVLAWLTLLQFKRTELQYLQSDALRQVPQEALHENYVIQPNGSPDSWNKAARVQRAMAYFQMFKGDPFTNQAELRKMVWELDDPRLVKRLFQDPGSEQEDQAEQQAQEISIMLLGYPAKVNEADDDKVHLMTLAQFVQRRLGANEPITPEVARLFLMHGNDHTQAMMGKKDPMAKQITQQLMPVVQILAAIANQPESMPPNVTQMQQGGGNVPQAPPMIQNNLGSPPSAPSGDEQKKLEIAKGNLLVNMAKAGMAVNHLEVDKVLAALDLPPLATNPIPAVTSAKMPKPQPAA